ncbi:ABC transporter substrate-binding protein [Marinicrinis sediminis]|uniref:ABC transporter substrate-binding protein n=1 Tax=Marinicrinis sediminis TaxID=1652465 RepID=A0ABW5RAS6_9BACL
MKTLKIAMMAFLCLVLVLTGCSSNNNENAASNKGSNNANQTDQGDQESEITVLSWRFDPASPEWESIVTAFNEDHPNIKVNGVMAPSSEVVQKVTSMVAGNQEVDVLFTDSTRNLNFASKGLLEDLQPYIDESGLNLEEDYYVKSLSDHMYEGKTYGIPILNMTYFIFYNKDLFDKANVEYPTNDWTIDEFLDKAKKLTNKDDNQYGYNLRPWVGTHFLGWSYAMGGEYLSEDGSESLVNSEGSVEAMNFLKDLIYKHEVAPIPNADAASQGGGVAFESGNVAMNWSGSWDIKGTQTTPSKWDFNWGVAMPPKGEGGSKPVVISNAWGMYSKSNNKDAAWTFIEWWLGEKGQMVLAEQGEFPSNKQIAKEHAFTHLSEEIRDTVFKTAEEGVSRPTQFPVMARSEKDFGARMEQILSDKNSDVEKIMDESKEELDKLIKDIENGR